MPAAADLHELISTEMKAKEEDPKDVLFDMVFERLRRNHFIPQAQLDHLVELYCRWSTALGRKACIEEAKQIIYLAVHDFMAFVPLRHRKTPRL